MPITNPAIKHLGKTILDADKDKYGLKTDGNGNVVVPESSHFMREALKLDRKYTILADYNHYTHEIVFDSRNTKAMQNAGVVAVFDEAASPASIADKNEDYIALQKKHGNILPLMDEADASFGVAYEEEFIKYANLRTAGISLVPSDTRPNKAAGIAQTEKAREELSSGETTEGLLELYPLLHVMKQCVKTTPNSRELTRAVKNILKEYYEADWDAEIARTKPIRIKTAYEDAALSYYTLSSGIEALMAAEKKRYMELSDPIRKEWHAVQNENKKQGKLVLELSKKANPFTSADDKEELKKWENLTEKSKVLWQRLEDTAKSVDGLQRIQFLLHKSESVQILPADVEAFENAINNTMIPAELSDRVLEYKTAIEQEMVVHDRITTFNIANQSALMGKAVVRWGAGHFNNCNNFAEKDMDEYLGSDQTLVVGTVATRKEMLELLAKLFITAEKDLPDYLYMPAYTDGNGKRIPEQAISVEEWLKAEDTKAKAVEQLKTPSKGRE